MTSENSEWESDACKIWVRRIIDMFKLLPALQKLKIKCSGRILNCKYQFTALKVPAYITVERAIEDAVIEKMEKGRLRRKGIDIKVEPVKWAMKLSCDPEAHETFGNV
jgi:hypothetical protein